MSHANRPIAAVPATAPTAIPAVAPVLNPLLVVGAEEDEGIAAKVVTELEDGIPVGPVPLLADAR